MDSRHSRGRSAVTAQAQKWPSYDGCAQIVKAVPGGWLTDLSACCYGKGKKTTSCLTSPPYATSTSGPCGKSPPITRTWDLPTLSKTPIALRHGSSISMAKTARQWEGNFPSLCCRFQMGCTGPGWRILCCCCAVSLQDPARQNDRIRYHYWRRKKSKETF